MTTQNSEQKMFESLSTKEIETLGTEAFKERLIILYGNNFEIIDDIRNKGSVSNKYGCDLIIKINGITYYIELKTSGNSKIPTNIRFTHQTLSKMYQEGILQNLIVVCVYNLKELKEGTGKAKFKFFKFGKMNDIKIEPHFIIQSKTIAENSNSSDNDFINSFNDVLISDAENTDLFYENLFKSNVIKHMTQLSKK